MHQPQMRDHHVHLARLPLHRHVQQATLLEAVVADIVVADVTDRPAREHGVAVLAMARHGIRAVGHVVAFRREEFGLALSRPAERRAVELARVAAVMQANLLQADEVGIERLDAQPEVVDLQALARADAAHALVDVVGGHAQAIMQAGVRRQSAGLKRIHGAGTKRGSCSTASALLGEKQRSAASRQGSQAKRRCSRGFNVTAVPAGTVRPKTCSVLWVTPGA